MAIAEPWRSFSSKPLRLIAAFLAFWCVERWFFPSSNWVPLLFALCYVVKFDRHQCRALLEEMNIRIKRQTQNSIPVTPLEPCVWLNKLILSVWPNYMEPKLSHKLSAMLMKKLKSQLPRIFESIELQEFSLGLSPPVLGLQYQYWANEGSERVLHTGFEWDTNEMNIILSATLAGPIKSVARVVINSLHIKGDVRILPVLDGHSLLYSFDSTPEIHVGVAFGGNTEAYPSLELPGISTCMEKVLVSILTKTMIEPHRSCFSFPVEDLKKHATGAMVAITVISVANLESPSNKHKSKPLGCRHVDKDEEKTKNRVVEVKLDGVARKTLLSAERTPRWIETFEMMLDGSTGSIYLRVYEQGLSSMDLILVGSCKVKMKYVSDDSTVFWAAGREGSAVTARAEHCDKEVIMTVPIEGCETTEITLKIVVKAWNFSEAPTVKFSQEFLGSRSNFHVMTGRTIRVMVEEGRQLAAKDKWRNIDPYVLLQYGKVIRKTKTVSRSINPSWKQAFEFAELSGEGYLKLKCYDAEFIFDNLLGTALVNLEALHDDEFRDIWVPLGNKDMGEIRVTMEVIKIQFKDDKDKEISSKNGMLELVLLEARDLVAADLCGTSDPYVSVHYGKQKKRTKVVRKTLHPHWNQTLEFPDDGKTLQLFVKDYNMVFPTSNIGQCIVDYQRIPVNQPMDMWIPLQGVKRGEVHVRITRLLHGVVKTPNKGALRANTWLSDMSFKMSSIMKQAQQLAEEGEIEQLCAKLDELASLAEERDQHVSQILNEKKLLLSKIKELEKALGDAMS